MAEVSQQIDLDERHRTEASLKHALAMEAIGLIRTALHLQRSTYEAIIDAWGGGSDGLAEELPTSGHKSFELQVRMAKAAISFMHELDALADEAIALAHKERTQ